MVGKITSKGDRAMRAQVARRYFNLDGRGIKIGVISDSFNSLKGAKDDVLSGDLPGRQNPFGYQKQVRVLQDLNRGSDEGRAMMQIISDVAPGAELLFHAAASTGGRVTDRSFARAIKALARAGADIIVDDIGFSTTFYQDGLAAQTVDAIAKQGVSYFSAIGNDGNRSYESIFRPSTTFTFRGITYEAHDFDAGASIDLFQDVTLSNGSAIWPLLGWDQSVGNIASDMELFLVPATQLPTTDTDLLSVSTTLFSEGVEQPLEELYYSSSMFQTAYLVIARKVDPASPPTQVKWISTANGADDGVIYQYVNDLGNSGSSTIYGQPNAKGAIAVGAVQVKKSSPSGRFVPKLDGFSSQGGTAVYFDALGNRLSTPEIRQKPEVVGPNGVATTFDSFTGFNPFFGTSAAAPHVAAVAALLLQRAGGSRRLSPAQQLQLMQQTALPLDFPGNFRSGAGLVQADDAVLQAYQSQLVGDSSNNRLQGNHQANNLLGLAGKDRLNGSKGFDALWGGTGGDRLSGNNGNDYLLGEAGSDQLVGGQGHDTLLGFQGRDQLRGNKGNDLLAGGSGVNLLLGGKGKNIFQLDHSGLAVIQDFQTSRDQIALDAGVRFQQLSFSEREQYLLVQHQGNPLAKLMGVTDVSRTDFRSVVLRA